MNKLAERLKELRSEKNLLQLNVSKSLRVAESTYSKWEQGRAEPNLDMVIEVAKFFNVTVGYLVGAED